MKYLIIGLVLFFVLHLIPSFPKFRQTLVDTLSSAGYMAAFNVLSLASIVLIVFGLMQAPFQPVYDPPVWGRHAAMLLMLPAIYLFFSNSVAPAPSTAKVITAHPMSWGVIVWATGHLLANGDLAHVLLFVTLGLYSVISILAGNSRGSTPALASRPPIAKELVFLVVVVIVYLALLWAHPYFTGMPLIPR